jgi:hypothetical protein
VQAFVDGFVSTLLPISRACLSVFAVSAIVTAIASALGLVAASIDRRYG